MSAGSAQADKVKKSVDAAVLQYTDLDSPLAYQTLQDYHYILSI